MKRVAVISGGIVENVVAQPDDYTPAAGEIDVANLAVGPGYIYDGENFASPPVPHVEISRARFDAVFAAAVGEVAYDDILDALEAIAATPQKTEQTVMVKRALRALRSPPRGTIDYPLTDWRTPTGLDLTAQFLKVVHDVMVNGVADIADKIDAGLAAWPTA